MKNKYALLNGKLTNEYLHNLNIIKGYKEKLIDIHNQEYIDFNSGLWNVSLGYNPELNQSIKKHFIEILDKNIPFIDITSYTNEIYNITANKLIQFIGIKNYQKVIYTNSGSETLEAALKIANVISDKKLIVSFEDSYHGTFFGDMTISGLTYEFNEHQNINTDYNLLYKFPSTIDEEKQFFSYLRNNYKEIKAIFLEPVLGSAGIYFREIQFYNDLISFCKNHNIITIFDEVATGFYKTGEKFFLNKLSIYPDIVCLGKSINNGTLPAATLVISDIISKKLNNLKIEHMSTQNGNILSIASIYETLCFYEKYNDDLILNVNKIESIVEERALAIDIPCRCIGSMIAIPIKSDNLNYIIEKLRDNKILVYMYSTEKETGISLFPNVNLDFNNFEKIFCFILKIIKKYRS